MTSSQFAKQGAQLVMCVIPNNRSDAYGAIKKQLCLNDPAMAAFYKTETHVEM